MDNKGNPLSNSKLAIASFTIAVSAVIFGFLVIFISMGDPQGSRGWIIWSAIIFLYLICLPIPAIVFASIDLIRIRGGKSNNNAKILDIIGMILGVIVAVPSLFFVILGLLSAF